MPISATRLRQNLYRILDDAVDSGVPIEIVRNGHVLKIVPPQKESRFERLEAHDIMVNEAHSFIDFDWTVDWQEQGIIV